MHWELHAAGVRPESIPVEDLATFERPGGGGVIPGGETWLWRSYVRRLEGTAP